MPLRERFKQSVKDFKSDARALFKRKDSDQDGTGPATTSDTQSQSTGSKSTRGFVGSAVDTVMFGPLKDLSDILQGFADTYIMNGAVKKEYEELQQRLQRVLELLEEQPDEEISPATRSKVQDMREYFKGELVLLGITQVTEPPGRLIMANEHEERFLACCKRIQRYMDRLVDRMSSLVGRLPFSSSACYNSSVGGDLKRRECTPGTRSTVLLALLGWARNNNTGVYWLNGMAGTGKTTIAYSVCKQLDADSKLGASFFCSRLREDCRNVNAIIPSIACQLAVLSHSFQAALSTVIERDPNIHTKRLDLQFKALIQEPLLLTQTALPEGLVVVIDALDECEDKRSTRDILGVLLTTAADLPIRFIVSSRPEPHIRDQMIEDQVKSKLVLHELDTGNVQADIETYLRAELKPMKPSPSEAQMGALVQRAGILFIYAATAVRYIGFDSFQRNPMTRLRTILDQPQGQKGTKNKEIDQLYSTILEEAFGDEELEDDDRADMKQVLHTVICAREPLTIDGLSRLLRMNDPDRVQAALRPLWSVVHVVGGSNLVTTLHASFPDYMFDVSRSKTHYCDPNNQNRTLGERCFEQIQEMRPQLNILGLDSSYLRDEHVANIDERVARHIPMELLYACHYWADHIKTGEPAANLMENLWDFLSRRLLLWMEVLNLNKEITVGMECMKLVVDWCKAIKASQELTELAQDAKRFVDSFASNPVSQSTPHIYVSALAFWPRLSPVAKNYAKYTQGPVMPEGTALDRRQPAHLSTWAFEKAVCAMAVSPDGLSLALGVGESVVVLDLSSGRKLLEPLKGCQNQLQSVAFSPDGTRVLGGSTHGSDATIVGWDTRSGATVLGPYHLHGHTADITCLSFSLDGTHIASGSKDCTVRLWDVEKGRMVRTLSPPREPLNTPNEPWPGVRSALFAPDGTRILVHWGLESPPVVAFHVWDTQAENTNLAPLTRLMLATNGIFSADGSHIISHTDTEISMWNDQSGETILTLGTKREPGRTRIWCIGCSPDNRYIVSGSEDGTVRVWDIQNCNIVLGPLEAHTGGICSVAFTPDGSRIISACNYGLVSTWDAQQRNLTEMSTSTPFHRTFCVKFSSDGTRFVSGSEVGTISIWDAHTGEMRVGPIELHAIKILAVDFLDDRVLSCHVGGITSVCDAPTGEIVLGPLQLYSRTIRVFAYSPNGHIFAVGLDGEVELWNAYNGTRVAGSLKGLKGAVTSIKFSPDAARIVAGSWAETSNIAVWDAFTGQNLFVVLSGHDSAVLSVSYSPNGVLIASGSKDNTIIVWDAYTGEKRLGPLTGHSSPILSVHFSPDNTCLVSGSDDRAIRIWDVQTGEMLFEILHGHEGAIKSVEYSPGGACILSCSLDVSARIHDARSPAERALSRSESEIGDWTIKKDGWVVDDQSRLLVWVPGDLRKALMWSETRVMVAPQGYVRLKFDKSRMGESWADSYTSSI